MTSNLKYTVYWCVVQSDTTASLQSRKPLHLYTFLAALCITINFTFNNRGTSTEIQIWLKGGDQLLQTLMTSPLQFLRTVQLEVTPPSQNLSPQSSPEQQQRRKLPRKMSTLSLIRYTVYFWLVVHEEVEMGVSYCIQIHR